jgi:signal transduction histidine kinase
VGAFGVVPIEGARGTVAVLSIAHHLPHTYDTDARAFFVALAQHCAQALERTRLFENEKRAREAAQESSRFAQTFVGILGHDLRNPLNAITLSASLLRTKLGSQSKPADRILSSAQRMSSMVDQLLDLTRSRIAGGIPIDRKPRELHEVISDVIEESRIANPGRQVEWESLGQGHGLWDESRIAQVVSNLVGNALQHGDPTKAVVVRMVDEAETVILTVHNEGTPIDAELQRMLFDAYRSSAVRGDRSRGLGLGLFITQQIVRGHAGHIEVRSSASEGTTFTVTLPRGRGLSAQEARPPSQLQTT